MPKSVNGKADGISPKPKRGRPSSMEMRKRELAELDQRTELKRRNQVKFLEGLKEMGTIRNGLKKAGVLRGAYRDWMANDPGFPDRVLDARQEFAEALEEVVVGIVMDPETVKKVPVLAITLLNANLPNKYRPTAIVQDETARDLLREWRKAARGHPKEMAQVAKNLETPVDQQIDEILKRKQESE
jgi:hypothetical protein